MNSTTQWLTAKRDRLADQLSPMIADMEEKKRRFNAMKEERDHMNKSPEGFYELGAELDAIKLEIRPLKRELSIVEKLLK